MRPHTLESALERAARRVLDLGEVAAARVGVSKSAGARPAAQQLVDGHPGALPFDVPQRQVHARERRHLHRAAAPVRASIQILPGVFDLLGVAADQQGRNVLLQIGGHRKLATVERRVTHPVEAGLAGQPHGMRGPLAMPINQMDAVLVRGDTGNVDDY